MVMRRLLACVLLTLLAGSLSATAQSLDDALEYFDSANYRSAAAVLEQLVDEDPSAVGARLWLQQCYLRLAEQQWTHIAAMSEGELAEFRRQYGVQELTTNEEATAEYERILALSPDASATREGLPDQRLIDAHMKLIERYPLSDVADLCYLNLADYYISLKDYPNAIVIFNRLIAQYPNSEYADDALLMKAILQEALGLYQESRETLDVILDSYPESRISSSLFGGRGTIYQRGNLSADRAYERSRHLENEYLQGTE